MRGVTFIFHRRLSLLHFAKHCTYYLATVLLGLRGALVSTKCDESTAVVAICMYIMHVQL